jgi:hypothetical protein
MLLARGVSFSGYAHNYTYNQQAIANLIKSLNLYYLTIFSKYLHTKDIHQTVCQLTIIKKCMYRDVKQFVACELVRQFPSTIKNIISKVYLSLLLISGGYSWAVQ